MPSFKFVISDKQKSYQIEKDQKDSPVMNKKISETISGDFLGLSGYELQVTGGSDKDGFPMRKDIEGVMRRRIIIGKGIGLKTNIKGLRRRRMLRGNTIAADIAQINCKIVKAGEKSIEELLGIKKEDVKAEIKEEIEERKEIEKEVREEIKAGAEETKEEKEEVKTEEKTERTKEEGG